MASTRVTRHLNAPRSTVYRALVDPEAVARWKFPSGMTCEVHEFEGRQGGRLRISLTYDAPDRAGKTTAHTDTYRGRFERAGKKTAHTDTYRGRFERLVPGELVVEVDEFETTDPALQGEMTITVTLAEAEGGTDLVAVHDGLPSGVSTADNETGWAEALARLAVLVEGR